jgi:hypothetical protein
MAVHKWKAVYIYGALTASIVLVSRGVALFKVLETPPSSKGIGAFLEPAFDDRIAFRSANTSGRQSIGYGINGSAARKPNQTESSVRPLGDRDGTTRNEPALDERGDEATAKKDIPNEVLPTVGRTVAFGTGQFGLGFRNSAMAFTWFVMYACENNFTSIVVESLNWEDFYGRGRYPWAFAPHSLLFDVDHWNMYYPQLPRLISVNATLSATTPTHSHGSYHEGYMAYQSYSNRIGSDPVRFPKSPIEITMLRGAFRPSQPIRDHMDKLTSGAPYAALHARIEPDMQKHMYCTELKVLRLSVIVRNVEAHFPNHCHQPAHVGGRSD